LRAAVREFTGSLPLHDDLTIVVLRREAGGNATGAIRGGGP
jgi:hypothetical protein